jgi:uncharacterized protein YodC (DUF2158 family)
MGLIEMKRDTGEIPGPFKVGDIVCLKSGGVGMSVGGAVRRGKIVKVAVDWVDLSGSPQERDYDARQLELCNAMATVDEAVQPEEE